MLLTQDPPAKSESAEARQQIIRIWQAMAQLADGMVEILRDCEEQQHD